MTKKEYKKLLRKANSGDAEAQWEIGYYFEEGLIDEYDKIIVKNNPKKALDWYKRSATQGYSGGELSLGNIYSAKKSKKNITLAIYWYKKAYKQGCASSAFNLGCIYRDQGKFKKAFKWYLHAVKLNDLDALFQVALCHLFGIGTKKDPQRAYESLTRILNEKPRNYSQRTEENAQYWLGIFHLYGIRKVKRSIKKARKLLEKADTDLDYDQANALLWIIGRTESLISKN